MGVVAHGDDLPTEPSEQDLLHLDAATVEVDPHDDRGEDGQRAGRLFAQRAAVGQHIVHPREDDPVVVASAKAEVTLEGDSVVGSVVVGEESPLRSELHARAVGQVHREAPSRS